MRDPEDYKLADLYDRDILNEETTDEAFEPRQRTAWQGVKDRTIGALGGKVSSSRNKLTDIYNKVWAEYTKSSKKQSGIKNTSGGIVYTIDNAQDLLETMGVDPAIIQQVATSGGYGDSREDAGAFIYAVLQAKYGQGAAYKPSFKLPPKI